MYYKKVQNFGNALDHLSDIPKGSNIANYFGVPERGSKGIAGRSRSRFGFYLKNDNSGEEIIVYVADICHGSFFSYIFRNDLQQLISRVNSRGFTLKFVSGFDSEKTLDDFKFDEDLTEDDFHIKNMRFYARNVYGLDFFKQVSEKETLKEIKERGFFFLDLKRLTDDKGYIRSNAIPAVRSCCIITRLASNLGWLDLCSVHIFNRAILKFKNNKNAVCAFLYGRNIKLHGSIADGIYEYNFCQTRIHDYICSLHGYERAKALFDSGNNLPEFFYKPVSGNRQHADTSELTFFPGIFEGNKNAAQSGRRRKDFFVSITKDDLKSNVKAIKELAEEWVDILGTIKEEVE